MLDMLSIVSYASQVPPYKVEIHEWIFHCELKKFIFWYFTSVLKLCMWMFWFPDSSPYTNVTWVKVKGMCWSQITTDNSICKYSTQSIHACPCCTDSSGMYNNSSLLVSCLENCWSIWSTYVSELTVSSRKSVWLFCLYSYQTTQQFWSDSVKHHVFDCVKSSTWYSVDLPPSVNEKKFCQERRSWGERSSYKIPPCQYGCNWCIWGISKMRSLSFWQLASCHCVIGAWCFATTQKSHLKRSHCPKTLIMQWCKPISRRTDINHTALKA